MPELRLYKWHRRFTYDDAEQSRESDQWGSGRVHTHKPVKQADRKTSSKRNEIWHLLSPGAFHVALTRLTKRRGVIWCFKMRSNRNPRHPRTH
jgi:tRNA(Phe) wybutosine-synthesizing methylase Tyw3